jgi:arginase
MKRIIDCCNFYGQKKIGKHNILFPTESRILSHTRDNLDNTLTELYNTHETLPIQIPRVTIGGDHSTSIATLAWTLNNFKDTKVLWIDAHADINTPDSSSSGNYHGMPLSFLTGLANPMRFRFINNILPFKNLLYVGIRDIDKYEKKIIEKYNIDYVTVEHLNNDKHANCNNFNKIFDFMGDSPVHVSFDVDALDPKYIKSTGTPVKKGISLRKTQQLFKHLTYFNVVNMDIMEFNPNIGSKKDIKKSYNSINSLQPFIFNKYDL